MSNLLEQASLVMIPSGYKEDIVYSEIPIDGSGDLQLTRASNGTRINSAGLVEVCPWNLLTYSEELSNGVWQLASATIGTNATTAPNGTTTAESFTSLATSANHVAYQLLSYTGGSYTYSVYVKKANSRYVYIKLVGDASQWVAAVFDLNDGTLTKSEATGWTGLTASSESVGNGWYRLIVSGSGATSVNFNVGIQYTNTGTPTFSAYADASFTGTGTIDYYIWGAQLNIGATAKPYFPTTDRLNVPRLTYQNGGGGCPSLLLEKQSTNLVSYSEQFDNVDWYKNNYTITANATTSPDGTQNADLAILNNGVAASAGSPINQGVNTSGTVCFSIFIKNNGATGRYIIQDGNGNGSILNLNNFTIAQNNGTGTGSVQSFGNGWYRFIVVITGYTNAYFYTYQDNFTGNGTNGIYIWGAQAEQSSYPTSYIPTTSSSATRVADVSQTSVSSSILPQASGTIFLQFDWQKAQLGSQVLSIHNNSTNLAWIAKNSATEIQGTFFMSAYIGTINYTLSASAGVLKVAYAWTNGSQKLYINGTEVGSANASISSSPFFNLLELNGFWSITKDGCEIQEAVLFQTKLTDAELTQLTA